MPIIESKRTFVTKVGPAVSKSGASAPSRRATIKSGVDIDAIVKAAVRSAMSHVSARVSKSRVVVKAAPVAPTAIETATAIGQADPVALVASRSFVSGTPDATLEEAARLARDTGGIHAAPSVYDVIRANRIVAAREAKR